jgi:rsbT co-antagonist protein RsbR
LLLLFNSRSPGSLLGTRIILKGIRPEIAQKIVGLGIDTSQIRTEASLAEGLRYALQLRGLQIGPRYSGGQHH